MQVKYCDATCQKNHWATHKKPCKQRVVAERMSLVFHMLWEEALFQDPPAKEDCPICYLPMPVRLLSCISFVHPRLYHRYQLTTLRINIRRLLLRLWMYIIHVAEKTFAKDVYTPFKCLVTLGCVPFANQTDLNHIKRLLMK